ncbi:MAG: ComF family protein [Clostridia bacterium]|nr:ComF family protein [Clostridia bacterium]
MKIADGIKRICVVRKCACCRTILSVNDFEEAFCSSCNLGWQAAKTESCPECYGAASECSCMPKQLSRSGALTLRKLFFYSAKKENEPQNRLVYYLKHNKSKRVSDFVARELCGLVREEMSTLGIAADDLLILNVPRGRRAVYAYGFDQSAEICRSLSELIGCEYFPAIKRRYGGKEQKKLNAAERRKNIKSLMRIREDDVDRIKGKYILLFDDVVTTGASMSACVSLLRKAGARGILCFSTASDIKKEISPVR